MEFIVIVKLLLLVFAAFTGISYLFNRNSNKQNLQAAIDYQESIRQLTDQEIELLKPYLDNKILVVPYKYQSSLVSNDVSIIKGNCHRHSLSNNNEETSYYFTIGDIEVFFPYNMENYTTELNVAEVVFTRRYAFVINLNGYDLSTAKADLDAESSRNEQWSQGGKGQFKTVTDKDIEQLTQQKNEDVNTDVDKFLDHVKNSRCEILEQRDETTFEYKGRNQQNYGILTVIFLTVMTFFTLTFNANNDSWKVVVGVICLILAAIFYWHKPKNPTNKVNRIKGTIEGNNPIDNTILVGDSLILTYPKHWQLPEKTTIEADMDVSVEDKKLIRYGHSFSIHNEVEQFGSQKFWGRNCFIFIAGFILCGIIYLYSSSIKDDYLFIYRTYFDQVTSWNINNEDALKKSAIKVGDWVNISLSGASCGSNDPYNCKKILINPKTVNLDTNISPLPEWAEKLVNDKLLIVKKDRETQALERYEQFYLNRERSNNFYNKISKDYVKLIDVNQLILAIDESCKTNNNGCSRLKKIFEVLISANVGAKIITWEDITDYAKNNSPFDIIATRDISRDIRSLFVNLSSQVFAERLEQLSVKLAEVQEDKDNLSLILTNKPFAKVTLANNKTLELDNNVSKVNYYYNILTLANGQVELYGFVSGISYQYNDLIELLMINPDYRYKPTETNIMATDIIINVIFFSILILITVSQGILLFWKVKANKRRLTRIKNKQLNAIR